MERTADDDRCFEPPFPLRRATTGNFADWPIGDVDEPILLALARLDASRRSTRWRPSPDIPDLRSDGRVMSEVRGGGSEAYAVSEILGCSSTRTSCFSLSVMQNTVKYSISGASP